MFSNRFVVVDETTANHSYYDSDQANEAIEDAVVSAKIGLRPTLIDLQTGHRFDPKAKDFPQQIQRLAA